MKPNQISKSWVLAGMLAWGPAWNSAPAAAWPERVGGFAYAPFRAGQDPASVPGPGEAEMGADLDLLASRARAVRLYSLEGPLARIPALATARGMSVTAGVSLGPGPAGSEESLERFLAAMGAERHVHRAIIGNESVLRGDLRVEQLSALLDRARERLAVPVSTAEPWHVWLRHPELARHVDFITVHLLPYWEGVAAAHAADFVDARMAELHAAFPDKPVVIGEMGWPSHGRSRGDARASPAIQARVLAGLLARAEAAGYDYFIMEAFDQPWKRRDEGAVGAYWGVFDVHRRAKLTVDGAPVPGWREILGSEARAGCGDPGACCWPPPPGPSPRWSCGWWRPIWAVTGRWWTFPVCCW